MILRTDHLVKAYPIRGSGRSFAAVRDVSIQLAHGETLGVVGESGCGKSTLARMLVGLELPTAGRIELDGVPIAEMRRDRRRLARCAQIVFQDPYSALNPRITVQGALSEVLRVHRLTPDRHSEQTRVGELLEMVGLASSHGARYPHELSGGQKQRVGIARALAVEPAMVVLDEPVSSLDVSVRAQVMNLLVELRDRLGLSYVFISHDLGMVRQISDRVAVMYLGRVVEEGAWQSVLDTPLHPYTSALAEAVPTPDPVREAGKLTEFVPGEVPNPASPPTGCAFHPRCPVALPICATVEPPPTLAGPGRRVACHVVAQSHSGDGRSTRPAQQAPEL